MKLFPFAAVALLAASPAIASASGFLLDFENSWSYSDGAVNDYYNGGTAADGSSGANLGVSMVGISGLSNDSSFTFYVGAPSPQGTAYTFGDAFINVSSGVGSALSFYYSTPSAVTGAVKAYSGLNGTGALLGTFDLPANDFGGYNTQFGNYGTWTPVTFSFTGTARSFDLTASGGAVGFDNISAVPEASNLALMLAGGAVLAFIGKRRRMR